MGKLEPRKELNETAAAMWLLVWQEPSDRALKGWCPEPWLARYAQDTDESHKELWYAMLLESLEE